MTSLLHNPQNQEHTPPNSQPQPQSAVFQDLNKPSTSSDVLEVGRVDWTPKEAVCSLMLPAAARRAQPAKPTGTPTQGNVQWLDRALAI